MKILTTKIKEYILSNTKMFKVKFRLISFLCWSYVERIFKKKEMHLLHKDTNFAHTFNP